MWMVEGCHWKALTTSSFHQYNIVTIALTIVMMHSRCFDEPASPVEILRERAIKIYCHSNWLAVFAFCSCPIWPLSTTLHAVMTLTCSLKLRSDRVTMLVPKASDLSHSNHFISVRQRNPLTFFGNPSQDVDDWTMEFERVIAHNGWDNNIKLANVIFYLCGTAQTWLDNHEDGIQSCDGVGLIDLNLVCCIQ